MRSTAEVEHNPYIFQDCLLVECIGEEEGGRGGWSVSEMLLCFAGGHRVGWCAHVLRVFVCMYVCVPAPTTHAKGLCCYPVKDEGPDSLHVTVNFGSVRAADRTRAVRLRDKENGIGL